GGDASGSFEASLDSTRELLVKGALHALEIRSGSPIALPSVTSALRADFEANGHTTFNIPLHLDYGTRTADMVLSGPFASASDGPRIDARPSGAPPGGGDVAV